MKAKLALFLLTLPLFAAERVVVARDFDDLNRVNGMLNAGWTVKHQSAIGVTVNSLVVVFTLIPPDPVLLTEKEHQAKARADEEKRLAEVRSEYARKRAEWLAKQPKVEKP